MILHYIGCEWKKSDVKSGHKFPFEKKSSECCGLQGSPSQSGSLTLGSRFLRVYRKTYEYQLYVNNNSAGKAKSQILVNTRQFIVKFNSQNKFKLSETPVSSHTANTLLPCLDLYTLKYILSATSFISNALFIICLLFREALAFNVFFSETYNSCKFISGEVWQHFLPLIFRRRYFVFFSLSFLGPAWHLCSSNYRSRDLT